MVDRVSHRYQGKHILRRGWSFSQRVFARIYVSRAMLGIRKVMSGLGKEASETRKMAELFFRLLDHKLNMKNRREPPSREEVKEAIEQLKDVGRLSVFISAVILPAGVFSLLGLELLARKFGIRFTFIPSSFRKKQANNDDLPDTIHPNSSEG